ncbi:MAG: hypothetical protein J5815_00890 [Clostridia bacterium]|nr:hypothetical protein [Clostridia bacterium]
MKKKIAILTVVIALIVVFAVVFTSCSSIANKISDLIPGGDGDGDGGYNMASDHNSAEIEANLNRMAENGVFVKLRAYGESDGEAEEDTYYAYGVYGDTYYLMYGDEEDQIFVDLSSNDYMVSYTCNVNESGQVEWTKNIIHYAQGQTKEQMKARATAGASLVWVQLGCYVQAGSANSKTTASMLGRTCDKYVVSQSGGSIYGVASISYEYWIDQATGACLKYCISGSATTVDGSASGSFGIEATNFDTNWRPQLPRVTKTIVDYEDEHQGDYTPAGGNQQGGQQGGNGESGQGEGGGQQGGNGESGEGGGQVIGGEGEEEQYNPFVGKRLAVTAVSIPSNRAIEQYFEGGYVQLYTSLDFECISDFGCLLGHYVASSNATSGTAHLNTMKIYADGKYDYESAESMAEMELVFADDEYTLTFALYVEDTLTNIELTLELEGPVQGHDNDVCPLDPNGYGIDPVYQVTQAVWDGIFKGDYLFEEIGNFTVDWDVESQTWPQSGTLKVDYDNINDDDLRIHVRESWTPDENNQYDFHIYYTDGNGGWADMGTAQLDLVDYWDQFTGAIPADFLKAGYNSVGYNYYINSFSYIPSGESSRVYITNFRVWFRNGLLVKIEYTRAGETLTFEFYDYGDTEVQMP